MSLKQLHLLGSPVLRQRAHEVARFDDGVKALVADLYDTMRAARGVGLAANQIGVARRVAVAAADDKEVVLVNPVIVTAEGEETAEEGCLSIPDIFADVSRATRVVVETTGEDGQRTRVEGTGLFARAIQHEIDHLDGILFLDRIGPIKRRRLLADYKKSRKNETGYLKDVVPEGTAKAIQGAVRVVYFGTPDFAVPSLRALVGEGFDVVGVVTRPDKPTGRHRSRATPSAVKVAALQDDLAVLQPERPSTPEFLAQLRALAPDLSIVAAYGHILPQALLDVPARGSVNVHASLLPALRGAAPIQRAVLAGLTETGITIMQMDAGMDTGPILHQVATPIAADETGGELTERLAELGAEALIEALTLLDEGALEPKAQDHAKATLAPKIRREEERLDWSGPADALARRVRAFDPKPGAWTSGRGTELKLFGAKACEDAGEPGRVLRADDVLVVAAGAGAVSVAEVQPAGRARMSVRAFVNGRGIAAGDRLA